MHRVNMKITAPLIIIVILVFHPVDGSANNSMRTWYDSPATKWEEAIPIGNGKLGAMVFGGITNEVYQLNDNTLYSGYPGHRDLKFKLTDTYAAMTNLIAQRKFAEAESMATAKWLGAAQACYQPLGDLSLVFRHSGIGSNYMRELEIDSAITRIKYEVNGIEFKRETFASHPDGIILIRITASHPASLDFRINLSSQHITAKSSADAQERQLVMRGQAPGFVLRRDLPFVEKKGDTWKYPLVWDENGKRRPGAGQVIYDGKGMFFNVRLVAQTKGGTQSVDNNSLIIEKCDEAVILLTADTSFNGYNKNPVTEGVDCEATTKAIMDRAQKQSFTELRERHTKDYRQLFGRVQLKLGEDKPQSSLATNRRIARFNAENDPTLPELYFNFGRYLMISGSRPGSQPLNLQGIWNPHIIPPWAGAYTVNINAEMNYWPAEIFNLSECHEPLLRMVSELSVDGQRVARELYGRSGWVAHHNTTIWRDAQPVDGGAMASYWCMAGPWLCQHLFEHYQHTLDKAFLSKAYSIMKMATEFQLEWLVDNGEGRLVTPVSTSPENAFVYEESGKKQKAAVSAGCTADMALIRDLFGNTIRAGKILGIDEAFRQKLETTIERLLPYQIGANGRLQEWQEDFADADPAHRHISHLIALHPSSQITVRGTPELAAAAKRTLELRGDGGTGWSKAWKVNFWARLEDGNHSFKMLSELISKSTMPNMLDTHPPFQIDGNFGGISGIGEMLIQSHVVLEDGAHEIHLLPALPQVWPDGYVKGLRVRGGIQADMDWQHGKLIKARLTARESGFIHVRSGDKTTKFEIKSGGTIQIDGDLKISR